MGKPTMLLEEDRVTARLASPEPHLGARSTTPADRCEARRHPGPAGLRLDLEGCASAKAVTGMACVTAATIPAQPLSTNEDYTTGDQPDLPERPAESSEAVADEHAHVLDAPVAQLGEDLQPELRALTTVAGPTSEDLAATSQVTANAT